MPPSRGLLETAVGEVLADLPDRMGRMTELSGEPVHAARMNHAGERSFGLCVPADHARAAQAALTAAGEAMPCGTGALGLTRLEKGALDQGPGFDTTHTPALGFAVARGKEFVGRAAVEAECAPGSHG